MNVYDFDGTIYHGDSTVDFYFYALRHSPSLVRYLPKQLWAFGMYGLKRMEKTRMKEIFYTFLQGIDAQALVERFWDSHQEKIYSWYPEQQEQTDVVISASPEFLLEPICARLGIRHLMASRVDAKTGSYTGVNCWGPEKVLRFRERFPEGEIENFYSDSHSDQPLADLAERAWLVVKGKIVDWT